VMYRSALTDLPEEEVRRKLDRLSMGRTRTGFTLRPEEMYALADGRKALLVRSDEAANDRLLWSHSALAANDDRRFNLGLALDAFGSFEGYLFDVLRNKNGWCYGAYAFQMNATIRPGRVGYYADPSRNDSSKLIPAMMQLIETFPDAEEYKERFIQRPMTFKNRYNYQLDPKFKLSAQLHRDLFGIPILSREEYYERIDAVTPMTTRKVLDDVITPHRMFMVFYGDSDRLAPILTALDSSISIRVIKKEDLIDP
jgi:predicted Zn-dependent peptidase